MSVFALLFLLCTALIALSVGLSSCGEAESGIPVLRDDLYLGQEPASVAVEGIDGVPDTAYAGTDRSLNGTVKPDTATHTDLIWSVAADSAGTGVMVENGVLKTSRLTGAEEINYPATVTVRATIPNGREPGLPYTQDFDITVYGKPKYGIQLSLTSKTFESKEVGYSTIEGQGITITNIGEEATGNLTLSLGGGGGGAD
jgi:hypothetical protein